MNQNSQNNLDLVKFLSEITNSEEKTNDLKNKLLLKNNDLINLVKILLNNNVDSLNQISEVINQSTNDGEINLLEIPNIVLKIFGISSKINKDTFSKNNLIDFIKFILLSIVELNVIKVNGDKFSDLLNVSCVLLESKLEFSSTDIAKDVELVINDVKVVTNSCCYPSVKKNRAVTSDVKVNKVDPVVLEVKAESVTQVDESKLIVSTNAKVNKVSNCCVPSVKKNNVDSDVKVEPVVPEVNVVPDVKVEPVVPEAVVPEVNVVSDVKVEAVVPEVKFWF